MESASRPNVDPATVAGFGFEWSRFDQSEIPPDELLRYFDAYFSLFPWDQLPANAIGFDLGCGSGRWAELVAPRVGLLHCLDASPEAIAVATRKLAALPNCRPRVASVSDMGLADGSMDFGYSLGVLHHVPDTVQGLRSCVAALKPGAPFLVYLYYALDGRPFHYRFLWKCSNLVRGITSSLPHRVKAFVTDLIALFVYWPLSRTARLLESVGLPIGSFPLMYYRRSSFQTLRTDALDRFGTPLERRFTRAEIHRMLEDAGLTNIRFREGSPFWCALGLRSR